MGILIRFLKYTRPHFVWSGCILPSLVLFQTLFFNLSIILFHKLIKLKAHNDFTLSFHFVSLLLFVSSGCAESMSEHDLYIERPPDLDVRRHLAAAQ